MNNRAFIGFDESVRICDTVESFIIDYFYIKQEYVTFGDYTLSFNLSNNNTYDDEGFERNVKSLLEDLRYVFRNKPYVLTFQFCEKKPFESEGCVKNDWHCDLTVNKIKVG